MKTTKLKVKHETKDQSIKVLRARVRELSYALATVTKELIEWKTIAHRLGKKIKESK